MAAATSGKAKRSPGRYARIYAIAGSLGMSDQDLKDFILCETGKDSKKLLSDAELDTVCRELERRQGTGRVTHRANANKQYSEKSGGMTKKQQDKVWALMYELKKYDPQPNPTSLGSRLAGIIRRELHMDATEKEPFRWLAREDGIKLIDVIDKGYIKTARCKVAARRESG